MSLPDPAAPPPPTVFTPRPAAHPAARHHAHRPSTFHRLVAHSAAPPDIPPDVTHALQAAMEKEGVPNTWENGLQFIVGHESGGRVGISNTHDSARGLFQLTRAQYNLNPNGPNSFGNAVEEAQGGIRYIVKRYQTADNAVQFWRQHRYY